jgi:hypothetical protein
MKIFLCLSLLFSISPLHAETWSGTAQITFGGTSTLHAWGGKVAAESFKADVTMNGGQPQRVKAEVTVKAANMDTAEPKRDANMLKAMKVDTHPLIVGKIDAKFSEIAAASIPTKLPIELDLLGKSQNVTGTISNWKLDGTKASFDLDFPVSMKASGISVPAVLIFIRVGDGVHVHASVTLTRN